MSRKYQNLVGAIAWIASRDAEAADDLNDGWNEAGSQLDRVVVALHLNQLATAKGVEKAKAELVAACEDGHLVALGHTETNEETRPIPETAWIKSDVYEVEGGIGKDRSGWRGLTFKTADLRKHWQERPQESQHAPKKATGPHPEHRDRIKAIFDLHEQQVLNAIERGDTPPAPLTSDQIAKKLKINPRTVRHNINAIRGGNNGRASGAKT